MQSKEYLCAWSWKTQFLLEFLIILLNIIVGKFLLKLLIHFARIIINCIYYEQINEPKHYNNNNNNPMVTFVKKIYH